MIARDQRQLRAAVREAVEEITNSRAQSRESIPLSAAEVDVLRRGGIPADAITGSADSEMAQTRQEYEQLLLTSLSAAEAATVLHMSPGAVTTCLEKRKLYGVKLAGEWRVLGFQLQDGGLVPGVMSVMPRLDPELHPIEVYNWFIHPEPNLEVGDEVVSPRNWLLDGRDPQSVAELAASLGQPL